MGSMVSLQLFFFHPTAYSFGWKRVLAAAAAIEGRSSGTNTAGHGRSRRHTQGSTGNSIIRLFIILCFIFSASFIFPQTHRLCALDRRGCLGMKLVGSWIEAASQKRARIDNEYRWMIGRFHRRNFERDNMLNLYRLQGILIDTKLARFILMKWHRSSIANFVIIPLSFKLTESR